MPVFHNPDRWRIGFFDRFDNHESPAIGGYAETIAKPVVFEEALGPTGERPSPNDVHHLREFINTLEKHGEPKRIFALLDSLLEITEPAASLRKSLLVSLDPPVLLDLSPPTKCRRRSRRSTQAKRPDSMPPRLVELSTVQGPES